MSERMLPMLFSTPRGEIHSSPSFPPSARPDRDRRVCQKCDELGLGTEEEDRVSSAGYCGWRWMGSRGITWTSDAVTEVTSVGFVFEQCDVSLISRAVMAAVDQVAAEEDVEIALLDALDYPLGETFEALRSYGIEAVDVEIGGGVIRLVVGLASPVPDVVWVLGENFDVVSSFFEVTAKSEPACIELSGSLA